MKSNQTKVLTGILTLLVTLNANAHVDFNGVAGIFYTRCASCHNPYGNNYLSLTNYNEILPYSASIKNVLQLGIMPPWQPDTNYRRFMHEKIITNSEKAAIIEWINEGSLQGNPALAPPSPVFSKYKLTGQPDKIVKIPNFLINSTPTHDAYNIFAIPLNLPSNKVVRAIEIVPNNPSVVHHVVVTVDTTMTMTSDLSGNAYGAMGQIALSGSLSQPVVYPNSPQLKTGVTIPQVSQLYVQMHYSASAGNLIDSTEFRLYFYPDNEPNIREMYIMVPLQNWYFWINPEEVKAIEVDTTQFNTFDVSLFSALPHSHQICKSVINCAYNPNGQDTIPLIKIDDWDFHHQDYYFYRNLVRIPAGYRYKGIHVYDNTSSNPNNPFSPPQWIPVGLNATDEMFFDAFQFLVYYPGDENIDLESIINNDTLWAPTTGISELLTNYNYTFAYPNPSNTTFTIQLVTTYLHNEYSVYFYDITGKEVKLKSQKKENSFAVSWNDEPNGMYFYKILSNKNNVVLTGQIIKR